MPTKRDATPTSLDRSKIKVVLLEAIHPRAAELFRSRGYTNVVEVAQAPAGAALGRAVADAHVVGIRSRTQLTDEVLRSADRLLAVGCFCIGTNQVALDAARDRGVPVFNAPYSNTRSVAELVVAEIVMLLRGIPERNALAHRGSWKKSLDGAREARGKTVGIVGYGHIGTQVGVLAEALGMRVVFHDIETKLALGNAASAKGLDDLLERSDVVTLHVPETALTHRMIGARQLARMREGAALINASRGTVVDLDALAASLESGRLRGAAIDVFPAEPEANDQPFESPLLRFDNVLLTPHIGGSTVEAQENIGIEVAEKLIKYSDNGSTLTSVNFPEVALPEHAGKHRLLHVHRNQPGVLAQVNEVFSRRGVNVAAQYLQTTSHIGYVVIDFDAGGRQGSLALKREMAGVAGTIRTRILY
ncbi:MAG TPA: phosphoglycerate dehydrogenase [Candidatus Polarisedimenticolaceae bacterium]